MEPEFNQHKTDTFPPFSCPLLIVDDDEGICRLLSSSLGKAGFTAEWCASGLEAMEWLRENRGWLLLLDLRLPDMTGQEVLEMLDREGIRIPYIVISGVDDMRVAVELMQRGALDYLAKDNRLLQLVVPVVRRCFDRVRQQRQLEEVEGRFLQLAANIDSVFWIAGARMEHFVYISPAYEKIWGRPLELVYENPQVWNQAVLPADRPLVEAALNRLKGGTEGMDIEYRILRPDGEIRWLHNTASTLMNPSGQVERLTGFVHDITERKEISRRLLAAAEQERRRLGAELHDDLCQRLAAIKLGCALLARNLRQVDPAVSAMANELENELGEATALARSLAQGLAPVALDTEDLVTALSHLATTTTRIFGLPVSFQCPAGIAATDSITATHLYRIAQELIANAAKHARPTQITVALRQVSDALLLEVTNDGKPFDEGPRDGGSPGMGLHLLRSRTEALGATLEFHSDQKNETGTRVLCTVPCEPIPL